MKTGAYWFSFLTEKEQEEFKVNCGSDEDFEIDMILTFKSFENFILDCFLWENTTQGFKYWSKISQRKTD